MPLKSPEHVRKRTKLSLFLAVILSAVSLLAVAPASAQGSGDLLMTTYPTRNFTGTPTTSAVTIINQTNLDPGGQGNGYSVRIEGFILAETTGAYTFETLSDDGVRMFLDGNLVLSRYNDHPPRIDTGTVNLVAGTWYPILIEHYENGGGQRLRLRWQTPTSAGFEFPPTSVLSQKEPLISSEGPPLATQDDRVAYIITEEASRSLRADILANQRANTDARARHAAATQCNRLRDQDFDAFLAECQDGDVSRSSVPLSFSGALSGTEAATKFSGSFFGQGLSAGGFSHIYFGDVDISRFEGGDVAVTLSGRYARERISGDRLLGFFLGLSATHTDIEDVVNGNRSGYGLSAGVYAVDQLTEALTWDAFLSLGVGANNLSIQDGGDDIEGDYNTASVVAGFAVAGTREFKNFELRPELNISFGHTDIGNVEITGGSSSVVDAGGVTLGRISLEPDVVVPLNNGRSRFDRKELWISPSLTCEYKDTTYTDNSCGGGLAIEWTADRDDGLLDVTVRASREVLGGNTRDSLSFRIESLF